MSGLAETYRLESKNVEAEPLYLKVIDIQRRVLGPGASRDPRHHEQPGLCFTGS